MVHHRLVSCRTYPVVTEDVTVWKYEAVVADDEGGSENLAVEPDEAFPTCFDALTAARAAVRALDKVEGGSRRRRNATQ